MNVDDASDDEIIRRFAEIWWADRNTFFTNTFLGVPALQHPFDAWITQEIIVEVAPQVIVEAGSFGGGSAMLWAMIQQQVVPDGRVIAIDLDDNMDQARQIPLFNERVTFVHGSSTDPAVVEHVHQLVAGQRALVILDSAHTKEHVTAEIDAYAPLVEPGSYLIVQDTFVNGHPLEREWGPGPFEAVTNFLATDGRFEVDRTRERMKFTFNPNGFLRRR